MKLQINKLNELNNALKKKIEKDSDENIITENNDVVNKNDLLNNFNKIKNENEELKNNIKIEHELISSSFYELALQFMRLQENNEIKNNILNNNNNTWIEKERKKNFPFDYYQE